MGQGIDLLLTDSSGLPLSQGATIAIYLQANLHLMTCRSYTAFNLQASCPREPVCKGWEIPIAYLHMFVNS